ncbi:unnamed protein product [Gulo gulo]|uniref:Uncharacterized protein n=1 Tax=Gulo gulo TaxID=48420 RepID=A0A9X9ME52_GULGU|nr:unnamed protein product [Gulo gulo]
MLSLCRIEMECLVVKRSMVMLQSTPWDRISYPPLPLQQTKRANLDLWDSLSA